MLPPSNSARTYFFMYDDVFNSLQTKCKSKNGDENDEKKSFCKNCVVYTYGPYFI